jgi:hypothetical protein
VKFINQFTGKTVQDKEGSNMFSNRIRQNKHVSGLLEPVRTRLSRFVAALLVAKTLMRDAHIDSPFPNEAVREFDILQIRLTRETGVVKLST